MPDDKTIALERPQKVTPEPVTPPAEPSPAPVDDFESKYKERLKADYGIDDGEEIKRWRADADEGRQYKDAFSQIRSRLEAQQRQPQQTQPGLQPPNLAQLRETARIDPLSGVMPILAYQVRQQEERMKQLEARTMGALAQREYQAAEDIAEKYVRSEYPEAYDGRTELHREGRAVYQSMPELQQRGDGFKIATEIAAARKGILPKSMRRTEPTTERAELDAQNIEKGTKRPPKKDDGKDDVPLTEKEKRMIAAGGIDAKTFKAAKAARAAGKNMRVE